MSINSFTCPNCGANYNPAKYRCEYCGSYIFMSNENYTDFSSINIELPQAAEDNADKHPGIYVFGRLLGCGEKPLTLGAANYFTGPVAAGGKLLLTNKSLSFSAHAFNVGEKETRIDLKQITDVKVTANLLISQHILVSTKDKSHKFVVFQGKKWVQKIKDAIADYDKDGTSAPNQNSSNYIEELQQLKQLLDSGIITEDEFNIKKRMILGI